MRDGMQRLGYGGRDEFMPQETIVREISPSRIWRLVQRHRIMISAIVVGAIAIVLVLKAVLSPVYTAEGLIAVTVGGNQVIEVDLARQPRIEPASYVRTVVEQLRSPDLARRVLLREGEERGVSDADSDDILADFMERLDIKQVDQSNVISIRYSSSDPGLAHAHVASVIEEIVKLQIASRAGTREQANKLLRARMGTLATRAQEAEGAAARYRAENGLIEFGESNPVLAQLTSINGMLVQAETDYAALLAEKRSLDKLIAANGLRAALGKLQFDSGYRMLESEVAVRQELAQAEQRYGESHPTTQQIRARYDAIVADVDALARQQIDALNSRVDVARNRLEDLQARALALEGQQNRFESMSIELKRLEADAMAARQLYSAFLSRISETDESDLVLPPIELVASPLVPRAPSFPDMRIIALLVAFGASGLCVLGMVVSEMSAAGLRTLEEIETRYGLRGLGVIPSVPAGALGARSHAAAIATQPYSLFSESVRGLATRLLTPPSGGIAPRSIMITSAWENEGKTSIASSVATIMAQGGFRVLLIDCDFRRPSLHTVFGVQQSPGVAEYATEDRPIADCLKPSGVPGLTIMTAGQPDGGIDSILSSSRAKGAAADIRDSFDYVIIDTSPVLLVADALALASTVDAVAMVVHWNETKGQSMYTAYRRLVDAGASVLGVVLSKVDMAAYAKFEEGQSTYDRQMYARYVQSGNPTRQARTIDGRAASLTSNREQRSNGHANAGDRRIGVHRQPGRR